MQPRIYVIMPIADSLIIWALFGTPEVISNAHLALSSLMQTCLDKSMWGLRLSLGLAVIIFPIASIALWIIDNAAVGWRLALKWGRNEVWAGSRWLPCSHLNTSLAICSPCSCAPKYVCWRRNSSCDTSLCELWHQSSALASRICVHQIGRSGKKRPLKFSRCQFSSSLFGLTLCHVHTSPTNVAMADTCLGLKECVFID